MGCKRGAIEELVKIIIVVVILALMAAAIILLFKGKGGDILEAIKNMLRFGRR